MTDVHLKDLLEAGCHFGHEVRRWHPKAAPFIYTSRDKIHIIDLAKTRDGLIRAGEFAKQLGSQGKKLLFVGTKRQAKTVTKQEAQKAGGPYFSQRWIGGFLTNWSEIKKSIDKLNKMDSDKETSGWSKFTKHEQLLLDRKRIRLEKFYGGVKQLKALPDGLFIVDIKKESSAIFEGIKMGVPIIGVVDTNSDPTKIDYPIPANDDAVKSITLMVTYIANAYGEGLEEYKKSSSAKATEGQAKEQVDKKSPAKQDLETPKPKETVKVKKTRGKSKKKS